MAARHVVEGGGTRIEASGLNVPRTGPGHSVALTASGRGVCFNEKESMKLLLDAEKAPAVARALLNAAAEYHDGWAGGDATNGHVQRAASLRLAAQVLSVIVPDP